MLQRYLTRMVFALLLGLAVLSGQGRVGILYDTKVLGGMDHSPGQANKIQDSLTKAVKFSIELTRPRSGV